jgi:hypothetical protein
VFGSANGRTFDSGLQRPADVHFLHKSGVGDFEKPFSLLSAAGLGKKTKEFCAIALDSAPFS